MTITLVRELITIGIPLVAAAQMVKDESIRIAQQTTIPRASPIPQRMEHVTSHAKEI